ncbi:probable kelch repeat-containing proteins [Cephalotrichum gorgonifer]|uniref:Probable kelch repeat-containing proteins n=1 Tax=Cephalotrichum gorgonifer TaxID=2041049 RepID=A0AAE8SZP7_9PEZI|nr:probable kelch repeat-containing proteins [Cephalotrichum gorgonifer]
MSFIAKWTRVASSQRLYRSSQAVSVVGQNTYIFGGELKPREPVGNEVDVVAIANGSESSVQTLPAPAEAPIPRVGSPSTTANGNIWIFSGRGGLEMRPIEESGALWRYDVGSAKWSLVKPADSAAPYPAGRSYHCVTSDGKNKVFVHSGCPESGRLSDLWVFDVKARTWSELPSAPAPARGGASVAYLEEKVYRINGFDGNTEQGGALDVFDISASSWSTISYTPDGVQGPEARSVSTLLPVVVRGKGYLVTMFGERDPSSLGHAGAGKMLSDAWAWDVEQGGWQKIAAAGDATPEPRGWFDADVVEDGDAILVHGGLNEDNKRLGDVWKLDFN